MPRIKGPRKVHQYSNEFKVTAVRLSYLPDVQVKDVAEELDIHPFMLSRWRKEYRGKRSTNPTCSPGEGCGTESINGCPNFCSNFCSNHGLETAVTCQSNDIPHPLTFTPAQHAVKKKGTPINHS